MSLPEITYKHFHSFGSTNDYATELLHYFPLVAVSADEQTEGRGRKGNLWVGERGKNVYLSFGIDHKKINTSINNTIQILPTYAHQMITSLMVLDVLREQAKGEFRVKYPNDIYAKGQNSEGDILTGKLCGIITEHVYQGSECMSSVIGIGINVKQSDFPILQGNKPLSINMIYGNQLEPDQLIRSMLEKFSDYIVHDYPDVFQRWQSELGLYQKEIIVIDKDNKFIAEGFTPEGRLLLSDKDTGEKMTVDNGSSIRYEVFS